MTSPEELAEDVAIHTTDPATCLRSYPNDPPKHLNDGWHQVAEARTFVRGPPEDYTWDGEGHNRATAWINGIVDAWGVAFEGSDLVMTRNLRKNEHGEMQAEDMFLWMVEQPAHASGEAFMAMDTFLNAFLKGEGLEVETYDDDDDDDDA